LRCLAGGPPFDAVKIVASVSPRAYTAAGTLVARLDFDRRLDHRDGAADLDLMFPGR
jgi:hypothetical protein